MIPFDEYFFASSVLGGKYFHTLKKQQRKIIINQHDIIN
jgi:hypothetical protein